MSEVRWLLCSPSQVPAGEAWLGEGERAKLAALRFPRRRTDFRLGRWTAKAALRPFLEERLGEAFEAAEIEIRGAADGAPEVFLRGEPAPAVLSLSHRGGLGLAAVAPAGTRLGCDLEIIEPRSDHFVADYLTNSERARLEAAPTTERALLANLFWSAKESALKALRLGLRVDVREVEVEVDRDGEVLEARYREHVFHGTWRLHGEYVLTWVVEE